MEKRKKTNKTTAVPQNENYCFQHLRQENNNYYITNPKQYSVSNKFKTDSVKKIFDFAYKMSFGKEGQHRDHRSGGIHSRRNGEIFANAFQGKFAECALYNVLYNCGNISEIDFNTYGLGKWDDTDIEVNGKKISVKSTKYFGNLLLLETKDWNKDGLYIPNLESINAKYDYIAIVRIKPSCEDIFCCTVTLLIMIHYS